MSEVIEAIWEVTNLAPEGAESWEVHDGFKITTSEQEVTLSISNSQSCCESWGYFLTEDDLDKFVGADLLGIAITDTNRGSRRVERHWSNDMGEDDISLDEGDVMFVDIETSRGVLQFVAYNGHNGYYGHTARVVSKQLTHEVGL